MDLRPAQSDGRELRGRAERVVVLVDEVLDGDQRNQQLGRLEQAQVVQISVNLQAEQYVSEL